MPSVRVIPATINKKTAMPINSTKRRKVAGYARVSTDYEEQASSYEAQVDYYTKYIKSRDDWEFVGIYTDEGISATNTKKREGFRSMVEDALNGKIDLIVTKSVSRFARNTVDSLTTVRKLKDVGVEIYFEKENIWTLDAKGELLITIMSSLAQEESRSISENTTWGQRKKMQDGRVTFAYSSFLGYEKDKETGKIVINEEQAKVVRRIYKLFLQGFSTGAIAKELTALGIKTPMGKDVWREGTVGHILTNEKYRGDALMQKTITVDFLQKKTKKNEGEAPQYYVEGNHPAIIEPELFDMVQAEMQRRKSKSRKYSGVSIFSNKIKCSECGSWYGSKVWHSTDQYRRTIYRCNQKYGGKRTCQTPHVSEDEIKAGFVKAFNELLTEREELIANAKMVMRAVCRVDTLKKEQRRIESEMDVVATMIQDLITANSKVAQDQDEYNRRYDELVTKYEELKDSLNDAIKSISEANLKKLRIEQMIKALKTHDMAIEEFDENLWSCMVDCVVVGQKKELRFCFRDGTEFEV